MVREVPGGDGRLCVCEVCDLSYRSQKLARRCEEY